MLFSHSLFLYWMEYPISSALYGSRLVFSIIFLRLEILLSTLLKMQVFWWWVPSHFARLRKLLFHFFFPVLGFELRVSYLLGKHSTTWSTSPVLTFILKTIFVRCTTIGWQLFSFRTLKDVAPFPSGFHCFKKEVCCLFVCLFCFLFWDRVSVYTRLVSNWKFLPHPFKC
jgi:hypothetical protein